MTSPAPTSRAHGPAGFAKHGHSRDGKPHNVQVIVAVVMVAGWPIAHHVWAGNEVDHTTVGKAIADLHRRFGFNRLVFVGDRGMVTSNNLDAITAGNHGYLVGLKRRRNKKLDKWLAAVDEAKWINCPVGITAQGEGRSAAHPGSGSPVGDRRHAGDHRRF